LGQRRADVASDQPAKAGSHASADGKRLRSIEATSASSSGRSPLVTLGSVAGRPHRRGKIVLDLIHGSRDCWESSGVDDGGASVHLSFEAAASFVD
jgi:hypothetical protein